MRTASLSRTTKETDITMSLNLDGRGDFEGSSGVGFFDHMLSAFCKHGLFDISLSCKGDLYVDCHHTVEDIGIVLGKLFLEAIGDKYGIKRCGSCYMPMDEALAFAAVDISGRGYLADNVEYPQEKIGDYDSCMTEEFMRAFAMNALVTLHINCTGKNAHHMTEGVFKAVSRALREAVSIDPRQQGIPSSKGTL